MRARVPRIVRCLAASLAIAASAAAQQSAASVSPTKGVFLAVPDGWSRLDNGFANLVELVAVPAERQKEANGTYPARLRVFVESRRDFAEAVRRLGEIAGEWDGRREYLLVAGWPALERRYELPLPQRGKDAGGPVAISPSLTFAVAYGATLVRLEGHLEPGADPRLLDTISRTARSLELEKKGAPGSSKRLLESLQAAPSARPPAAPAEAPGAGGAESPGGGAILGDELLFRRFEAYLARHLFAVADPPNLINGPVLALAGAAEISVAASDDAQDIVVATNGGFSFSNDGGAVFTFGGGTPGPNASVDGDPSVTWAESGSFYYGFIGFPDGTAAWNNVQGCSTGISASTDGGQTFPFVANATLCPFTGAGLCFPDQEHIAADRENAAAGGDQVYSVWRDFAPSGAPPNCGALGSGFPTPSIVCSEDDGANWTAKIAVDTGDFPRVGVGGDGFVYVTYRTGGNIMLNKFSSCEAGLDQQTGFPVTVSAFATVPCAVPGLDRCNNGNLLSSPTVAVSDESANRVFVAFANNTAAANDDVLVLESVDGGATFPRTVTVNTGAAARRFMPWVCSENGRAYASFYDRRAATAAGNDLTGFFLGEAVPGVGSLAIGTELDLTGGVEDPHCASGWPCRPRSTQDSESCSVQPQNAGRCRTAGGGGSNAACDFSAGCAAAGETCQTGGGCPKYGDYNYVACAGGRIVAAWASATPPAGVAGAVPAGINTFVQVVDAGSAAPCRPWNCGDPIFPDRGRLVLECAVRGCRVFDPVPKNCLVKWDCPGCPPGGLCPPWYEMRFEGFGPEEWEISLLDAEGLPVRIEQSVEGRSQLVRFRPSRRHYLDGQIGDYVLVFTLGPKGIPGKAYDLRTTVKRLDRPPGEKR